MDAGPGGGHVGLVLCVAGLGATAVKRIVVQVIVIYFTTNKMMLSPLTLGHYYL